MRVLFLTCLNKSQLAAMIPLGWALHVAGHEVHVASQPDLAADVVKAGFTPVPVGEPLNLNAKLGPAAPPSAAAGPGRQEMPRQESFPEDPPGHLAEVAAGFFPMVCPDSLIDDLVDYARYWKPDLVVWNTLAFAGSVAARACGAANARLLFGADGLGEIRSAFHEVRTPGGSDPMADWLGPRLARYGCEFDEEIVLGQWTMDPMPAWVPHPHGDVHYVPMRHVPYPSPVVSPEWLRGEPRHRRVVITLGTAHRDSHGIEAAAEQLMEAVADLDIEVIATLNARQTESLAIIPDNVRTVDFVPLNLLLPTCAAIVHHGGCQTFATALENGVPQLLVPSAYWTEMWWGPIAEANGLEARGAGLFVADSDHFTAEALRDALTRVLKDPSFGENAARLRTERLGTPTPNELVPVLERLTAQHRS